MGFSIWLSQLACIGACRASREDAGLVDDPPCDYQFFQQLSDTIATAPRICLSTVVGE
jgi:hypothetical protein